MVTQECQLKMSVYIEVNGRGQRKRKRLPNGEEVRVEAMSGWRWKRSITTWQFSQASLCPGQWDNITCCEDWPKYLTLPSSSDCGSVGLWLWTRVKYFLGGYWNGFGESITFPSALTWSWHFCSRVKGPVCKESWFLSLLPNSSNT